MPLAAARHNDSTAPIRKEVQSKETCAEDISGPNMSPIRVFRTKYPSGYLCTVSSFVNNHQICAGKSEMIGHGILSRVVCFSHQCQPNFDSIPRTHVIGILNLISVKRHAA